MGTISLYKTKFGTDKNPRILIKKGILLENIRQALSNQLGVPLTFYSREDSEVIGCFMDTVMNEKSIRCINAIDNGVERLLPLTKLENRACSFYAILRSRNIKKSEQTGALTWSLTVSEMNISKLPPNFSYSDSVTHSKPKLKFCKSDFMVL